MSNNVPARIPVRAAKEITRANAPSAPAITSAEIHVPRSQASPLPPVSSGLVLERRSLALALRFASRLASRAPIPALTGCLFVDGFLLATDLDGPAIAQRLFVSVNTMRTHTKSIYAKLGVNSRRAAVRRAEEHGLL